MTATRYAVEFRDHFGTVYLGGAHYTDKGRAREIVRTYNRELRTKGPFVTGAIPGYGVCVGVRLTIAPELDA